MSPKKPTPQAKKPKPMKGWAIVYNGKHMIGVGTTHEEAWHAINAPYDDSYREWVKEVREGENKARCIRVTITPSK